MRFPPRFHIGLIVLAGSFGQSHCSDSQSTSTRVVSSAGSSATIGGTIAGTLAVSDAAPATSIAGADIAVQNHPEISGTTSPDGSFVVENVLPGTLTVIVTSNDGSGLTDKPADYATMFKDVVVRAKETQQLGTQEFKKSGALKGNVTFFDNSNNLDLTGSDVYIPGTSFIAKTDDQGFFTLAGLPEGTLTLKAQHSGFAILSLDVEVKSGETVDLGELPLSLSNGPEGALAIQADSTPTIAGHSEKLALSRTVTLKIQYDKNSALMKISDEPSFLNRNWIPVASTYDWTFTTDGAKKLYVMFSDLNGLESSPYSDTIIVDTEAPALSSIHILNGWEQTAKPLVYIDVAATDGGSGVAQVLFSNSSGTFVEADAQTFSSRLDWTLSSADGAKVVYAKVRDYAGRESTVVQDNINLDNSGRTIVYATTYTDDITFKKAQSPFWIKSGADPFVFKGQVNVEGGATIYIDNGTTVKMNGVTSMVGSSSEPIIIRSVTLFSGNCMMSNGATLLFNAGPPGVTAKSVIRYTQFKSLTEIRFNGGLVENSTFDASGCTSYPSGKNLKTGLDNLLMQNNSFAGWAMGLNVTEGNGNTVFKNNSGTFSTGFSQSGTAANTTVTGNQFSTDSVAGYSSALLSWDNDNDIVGYASNSFTGLGTTFGVGSSRTTNLTLSGVTIASCYRPLIASNAHTTTLTQSTINCSYGDTSDSSSGATVVYSQNTITVSKALVAASYYANSTVLFTTNKLKVECGSTAGTYCDVFYAKAKECGVSANGNHGSSCSQPSCTAYNGVNANLSGNNIYCKGDASSGCRGLTLHLAPDDQNTEADELVTCDYDYGSALQLNINNNYWESSSGYKSLANGANLQTGSITDHAYTSSTNGTVTGASSSAITAYLLTPIANQVMSYNNWPTSVTTSAFNNSAPP